MKGIFNLKTTAELLQKLDHDLQLIKKNPGDPYLAFNFIVTAEQMLDWEYPGNANRKKRENMRDDELLQVCSHLATGAKHFIPEAKHHKSVKNSRKVGYYDGGALPKGSIPIGAVPIRSVPGRWSYKLIVEFSEKAAVRRFGKTIFVTDLATQIFDFWKNHLKPKGSI